MKKVLISILFILLVCSCNCVTEVKIHKLSDVVYVNEVDKYITSARSTDGLMHEYECSVFGNGSLSKGSMYHWRECKYCREREKFANKQR